MKYKLIALDIDGTLLNDNHEITEVTRRTIRRASDAGAKIVLCTGRGPLNTLPVLAQLGLDGTMITHNGAATVRSIDRYIIHQSSFPLHQLQSLIDYCRDHGIHMNVNTPFEMYVEQMTADDQLMYDKYNIQPIMIEDITSLNEPLAKFTIFGDDVIMDRVEEDWKEVGVELSVIRSGDMFVDVMSAAASKGNALQQIVAQGHIQPSEILAIGNYYNDIAMLEFAGLGIAMENSPAEVKTIADAVTTSNNDDGVAKALMHYFF